jgi:hypothetical protein
MERVMRNLIIVLVLLVCAGSFADSFDCFLRGDANGDGDVNIADVQVIAPYVMGQWEGPLNDNLDALDTNDDGIINIADSSYLSGILFHQYFWPLPNFNTGAGQDPSPDTVNNEGGQDAGDYSAGDVLVSWPAEALVTFGLIAPEQPDPWPDTESNWILTLPPNPHQGWCHWGLFTDPNAYYGVLGNTCWFHIGAGGPGSPPMTVLNFVGTAKQMRAACRADTKNSGPGINIPYDFDWFISMADPNSVHSKTKVWIDANDVEVVFTFGVSGGNDFNVKKIFYLGKYGLAVYANYGALLVDENGWEEDWLNSPDDVTGDWTYRQTGGTNIGILIVTARDIGDELPGSIDDSKNLYLKAVGSFNNEHGIEVWHSPYQWGVDATRDDEAQCILKLHRPTLETTVWENP